MEAAAIRPLALENTGISRLQSLNDLAALGAASLRELYLRAEVTDRARARRRLARSHVGRARRRPHWLRAAPRIRRLASLSLASRADGGPAFQLDYDNPENPFFIRAIKDEVRKVAPGLFLGQAYVTLLGKPRLALYFALQKMPSA